MGIVVNHCLEVSLTEMLEHLDIETTSLPAYLFWRVACGHRPWLCFAPRLSRVGGQSPVTDTVCLTGSQDLLRAIAAGEGPDDYLVALGYAASWAGGIRNGREQLAHRARR